MLDKKPDRNARQDSHFYCFLALPNKLYIHTLDARFFYRQCMYTLFFIMSRNIDCLLCEAEKQVELWGLPCIFHLCHTKLKYNRFSRHCACIVFVLRVFNLLQNWIKTKKITYFAGFQGFCEERLFHCVPT